MSKLTRILSLTLGVIMLLGLVIVAPINAVALEGETKTVIIDATQLDENPANRFKGYGALTCNNTSRLLLDYKEENPEAYWDLMDMLFNPDKGAGMTHVKIEMGNDSNTSSGTEPATMRSSTEKANVRRGAGFTLAADAKKINPKVEVSVLRWAPPRWVQTNNSTVSSSNYENFYKWYKETAISFYEEFGLYLDYINPDRNETGSPDTAFVIWFAERVKADDTFPNYDKVKIIASDENTSMNIANSMVGSNTTGQKLRALVDVMGYHYQMASSANYVTSNQTYNKEIWYSEGVAPQTPARYSVNSSVPFGGVTSALGIANRYIGMYTHGYRTFYIFQPAVSAMYSGAKYSHKEILAANNPWSGYYAPDLGIWAVMHFTQFAGIDQSRTARSGEGWYISTASDCYGNVANHGVITSGQVGDSTVDASVANGEYNRMIYVSPDKKDFSVVMVNDSNRVANFEFKVRGNITNAGAPAQLWETRGPDAGQEYDANWYKMIATVPAEDNGGGSFSYFITVKPRSMASLTTTTVNPNTGNARVEYSRPIVPENFTLDMSTEENPGLLYEDDFEYAGYPLDDEGLTYLERRGGTPRYTTDQAGAFEVLPGVGVEGSNGLQQMIYGGTNTIVPPTWTSTGWCYTLLGDGNWLNYKAAIDFKLDMNEAHGTSTNYAQIGVRHNRSETESQGSGNSSFGYKFRVYKAGDWYLYNRNSMVLQGNVADFDPNVWHNIALTAVENKFVAELDGVVITTYTDTNNPSNVGQIMLASGQYETVFDNLKVTKVSGYEAYATERLDDLDSRIVYENQSTWNHLTGQGGDRYNRTLSTGTKLAAGRITVNKGVQGAQGEVNKWFFGGEGAWGSYTDHWNSTNGAIAEFTFQGTGVEIQGNRGTDKMTASEYEVYIDGVQVLNGQNGVVLRSLNGSSSNNYTFATVPNLPDAVHTISIKLVKGGSSTNGMSITNALVDSTVVGPTPAFSFDFSGTGIDLIGDTAAAKINVYVDDELVAEDVAIASSSVRYTTSYALRGLEFGDHTLKVEVVGGSFTLDMLNVIGERYIVPVTGIELNLEDATIELGATATLVATITPDDATNKNVTWSSSDEAVATVVDGVVTAVGYGTATITATTEDGGLTATCEVLVPKHAKGIKFSTASYSLKKGKTVNLFERLVFNPIDATYQDVTWTIVNPTIASIDQETGVVTGLKSGSTMILVKVLDGGFSTSMTLMVTN